MRRQVLLAALIMLSSDMLAHPGSEVKEPDGSVQECVDKDVADVWSVYHPVGPPVPEDRNIEDGAPLAVTYDTNTKSFQAFLADSEWRVIGEPVLEKKCGNGSPNALLSMWIKNRSSHAPMKLCVERVRSEAKKAHRPDSRPDREQVGIFMVGIDQPCHSYHGEVEKVTHEDKMAAKNFLAPVTPGHSHADN